MTDYLPKLATIEEACGWLNSRTGKSWSLARMMEYGLMPWVWLDYMPGYPAIFGDRLEGYLAPMVFAGDTQRLEADRTAILTMTRTHDGELLKLSPGATFPLSEIRFKRENLEELASQSMSKSPSSQTAAGVTGDWKDAARAIADECFDADTRNNCRDSMAGYARRVMGILQEREIHGPRGLIDNPKTIERDALQGDKWWQHKKK